MTAVVPRQSNNPRTLNRPANRKAGWWTSRAKRRRGRPNRRIVSLIVVLVLLLGVSAWRLVSIQVLGSDEYVAWGATQRIRTVELDAARGSILDRDRHALVLSDSRPTIWADPTQIEDIDLAAAQLALVIDRDEAEIFAMLDVDSRFVYLDRQIDLDVGSEVEALGLAGVFITEELARLAPNGEDFARGLLGRLDVDHNPHTGLEAQYDDILSGAAGWQTFERGRDGTLLPAGATTGVEATRGDDLVLTIHRETQFLAEQILVEQVEATSARGGYAVIMRTSTGEVLAAAGVLRDVDTGVARPAPYNMVYLDTYEPGSVNKVFTISAALEAGLVTPETLFDVPHEYEFADKIFEEPFPTGVGELTVSEILSKSSNIGTVKIAELVGRHRLYAHLTAVGMGRRTGPDSTAAVPDESPGILLPSKEWFGTELAAISFGQGLALTPVQVAAAYNTIANGGRYVRPTLVRGVVDEAGQIHTWPFDPGVRAMSPETARQVTAMLEQVVSIGTGRRADVDGYIVAGKTGTAQKPLDGGYSNDNYMSTFAGFVPANNPRLTIVVILDSAEIYLAGEVAAPLFSELAEYALRTLRVPPTERTGVDTEGAEYATG